MSNKELNRYRDKKKKEWERKKRSRATARASAHQAAADGFAWGAASVAALVAAKAAKDAYWAEDDAVVAWGRALRKREREMRGLRHRLRTMWGGGRVSFRQLCKLAMLTDVRRAAFLRRKGAPLLLRRKEEARCAEDAAAAERSREAVELSKVCAPSSRAPHGARSSAAPCPVFLPRPLRPT